MKKNRDLGIILIPNLYLKLYQRISPDIQHILDDGEYVSSSARMSMWKWIIIISRKSWLSKMTFGKKIVTNICHSQKEATQFLLVTLSCDNSS